MNEQALPVLIAFLSIAGLAIVLLRRAFTSLGHRQSRLVRELSPAVKREFEQDADQTAVRSAS